jgi:hypothetical protein
MFIVQATGYQYGRKKFKTVVGSSTLFDGAEILENRNYYHLFYFFKTVLVEQEIEVLMYDFGGFLVSIL